MNVSTRRITGVAAAAAVVLVLVWYVALFRPESHHLSSARQAYAAAEKQVSSLRQQVVSLEAIEKQIPADKARLAQLDAAVPHSPDLRGLLDQLHALATATGVVVTVVSPAAPSNSTSTGSTAKSSLGGAQSTQVALTLDGSYQQMAAFLTGLSSMARSVVVDGANISSSRHGLAAQLTTQIFYTS